MNVHVVLVRPKYAFNVGSVSRVMANIGANRLILIDPLCEIDHEARKGAAGAQRRLLEADIYKDWPTFFEKEHDGVRLAFCGKDKKQMEQKNFAEKADSIAHESAKLGFQHIYLIFGTEDDGLSDHDLEYANHILTLPAFGEFRSLNLSHAVLLALYIWTKAIASTSPGPQSPSAPLELLANDNGFHFPEQTLKDWLIALGFDIENRDTSAYTVLKRLLLSRLPSRKELRILEATVNQTIRKLKNR